MKKVSTAKAQSTILVDKYDAAVKRAFDTSTIKDISKHIASYIDRNADALYYMAPTKRVPFATAGKDGTIILNALETTSKEMSRDIRSISSIRPMSSVLKEPVVVGITLLLREATIRESKAMEDQLMMYLIFSLYWSLQYRQFMYEPPEALVRYTVNNLSNKYLFKTQDNVFQALYVTGEKNHETSQRYLLSNDDKDIITYIMNIRTRVSSLLVRFTQEVVKNREEGKYLNTVQDSSEDETYYEVENITGAVERLATSTTTKFFQGQIDKKILNMAARYGDISPAKLREILIGIANEEPHRVDQIVRGILVDFVKTNNKPSDKIGGKDFIAVSLKILNKSNTKDPNIISIKSNLAYFLDKYSKVYATTSREATKNGYRKSLLAYFVLFISKVANS